MPRLVWMTVLLALLAGCESDEEKCNNARVAAHDAWQAYLADLGQAHEDRNRVVSEAMDVERERIRREYAECQARRSPAETPSPSDDSEAGPGVAIGQARVRGSLSQEAIRSVVQRHVDEVRQCYEQGLSSDPDLRGEVGIGFIVSPTGSVQSASSADSTLRNARVEACITRAVRQWTFPAPEGGGVVGVTLPFTLRPSGGASTNSDEAVARTSARFGLEQPEQEAEGEEVPGWLAENEDECEAPASAERRANILLDGRHPRPPSQEGAQRVADRIMGRAIPLRDALRDFRETYADALARGPSADAALEAADTVWDECQSVDP